MTLATITLYCSQTNVEQILSANGVTLRLDDSGDGTVSAAEQLAMDFALADAAETCNFYLWPKYSPSWLATSNWVNVRASWLATYALCDRRGNPCPESLEDRAEKVLEELERVHSGSHLLPGVPLRWAMAPVYSNVRADPRYEYRVLRVERNNSSRQRRSALQTFTDWREAFYLEVM